MNLTMSNIEKLQNLSEPITDKYILYCLDGQLQDKNTRALTKQEEQLLELIDSEGAPSKGSDLVHSDNNSTASDSGSINTQDALQLISQGIKLDHTDLKAPRPTPNENSPVSSLNPSNNSFSAVSSIEIAKKKSKSNLKDSLTSVDRNSPLSKNETLEPKKKKSSVSFFKRLSMFSSTSVDLPEKQEPKEGISEEDITVEEYIPEKNEDEVLGTGENFNLHHLNSMKKKNDTVLNLQQAKKQNKKKEKKARKQKEKEESIKQQRRRLKEYYLHHPDIMPSIPPAFLLDSNAKTIVPTTVIAQAEKSFPQTVKRASIVPPKLALPTPVTQMSKKSTMKRHSDVPTNTPNSSLAGATLKRNTMPNQPSLFQVMAEETNRGQLSVPEQFYQSNPNHNQPMILNQYEQTIPEHLQNADDIPARFHPFVEPQPEETPENYQQSQNYQQAYINQNNAAQYGYFSADLYTLSEKSMEESLHSRFPSASSNHMEPIEEPLKFKSVPAYQSPNLKSYNFTTEDTMRLVNYPALTNNSSTSPNSSEFFSMPSDSDKNQHHKTPEEIPDNEELLYLKQDFPEDDYANQVLRKLEIPQQPGYAPPPVPLNMPQQEYSTPPVPLQSIPQSVIPAPENTETGHLYKSLLRYNSDKSFNSTRVRINLAESDSDF